MSEVTRINGQELSERTAQIGDHASGFARITIKRGTVAIQGIGLPISGALEQFGPFDGPTLNIHPNPDGSLTIVVDDGSIELNIPMRPSVAKSWTVRPNGSS